MLVIRVQHVRDTWIHINYKINSSPINQNCSTEPYNQLKDYVKPESSAKFDNGKDWCTGKRISQNTEAAHSASGFYQTAPIFLEL